VKLKKLEVWRSIKSQIEEIQDQKPFCKRCMDSGTKSVEKRVKLKKLKDWKSIKDKIENIKDQEPRWKMCLNQEVLLKLDRGEIELILRIKIQLKT
jgi:chromosome condensin MukBEF complex kleisin-like MukF subunit